MILWLAPMDWFTDCAFRQITKEIFEKYGEKEKYDFRLWTEFMNADGYMINPTGVIRHLLTSKKQAPVVAQIFWGNEDMLLKCFADIQNKYAEIFSGIELNMWCPARNVMSTGGGSALLRCRPQTVDTIRKISWIMKMPFSVKTRTGLDEQDLEEQTIFLTEISKYLTAITVHWRTVKQGYADNGNWEFIYALKKKVDKNCKVIGNGWIKSYEDIATYSQWDGVVLDWVLIGQAAIGNPWVFTPHIPSRQEIKETILRHLEYMMTYEIFFQEQVKLFDWTLSMPTALLLDKPIVQSFDRSHVLISEFRKHLFQYVKWIPESKEFKQKVSTISEYGLLVEEIQNFFTIPTESHWS